MIRAAELNFDTKLRSILLSVALLIVALTFLFYALIDLWRTSNVVRSAIWLAGALIAAALLVIARSNVPQRFSAILTSAIFALICMYLVFSGGQSGFVIVWSFTFPAIAVFLLSVTMGTLLSALVFAALEIALFIPGVSSSSWPLTTSLIVTCVYMITFIISAALEWSRGAKKRRLAALIHDEGRKVLIETLNISCKLACLHHNKRAVLNPSISPDALRKTSLEVLKDIFAELVQNAVVHGIELPDVRRRAGIDETGIITLSIYEKNGLIRAELRDDGAGFDFKKISAENPEIEGKNDELAPYIRSLFEPNKQQIKIRNEARTGLNIVCSRLVILHGKVKIKTKPGRGTAFILEFAPLY
ncbi:MAG: hypothetical protein LBD22_05280 [Spirochaetaceae bacterium]|jgi:two-component sensor histidine kinase|nr:hypothetical protein [Spirochaetaceae bacterium]